MNAIINAAKQGTSIKNAVCYCTHKPCIICTKMLINAEIKEIYYIYDYPGDDIKDIIGNHHIKIIKI
jgi:dCMP deaminase